MLSNHKVNRSRLMNKLDSFGGPQVKCSSCSQNLFDILGYNWINPFSPDYLNISIIGCSALEIYYIDKNILYLVAGIVDYFFCKTCKGKKTQNLHFNLNNHLVSRPNCNSLYFLITLRRGSRLDCVILKNFVVRVRWCSRTSRPVNTD